MPIQRAWAELERRVAERTSELARTVQALEGEIGERKRVEAQKDHLHEQLVETSRRAGMAERARERANLVVEPAELFATYDSQEYQSLRRQTSC